jgi:catechol 2,3-dioxygenase-like lactoylglutathione lyase family enzyme
MTTAVKWFGHVNVNATDLGRSSRFYRERFGLDVLWRTEPGSAQDGALFGRPGQPMSWRGELLADHRGRRGPLLDLLQWAQPTTATSYRPADAAGFARLVFAVPDVAAVLATGGAGGRRADGAPETAAPGSGVLSDPDGTPVLVTRGDANQPEFVGVQINCASLEQSVAWYRGVAGLTVEEHGEQATVRLPGGRDRFRITLIQVLGARPYPHAPYEAGIHRLAMVADEIDAGGLPAASTGLHEVELGSGLGRVRAVLFPDPDGAVLEFVERGLGTTPAAAP